MFHNVYNSKLQHCYKEIPWYVLHNLICSSPTDSCKFIVLYNLFYFISVISLIGHNEYVTESVLTGLITHDRRFDFITQTQSLMNALFATDNQSKGICFF